MMKSKQKLTPFLWFDGRAEEAARYYTSIFKRSRIVGRTRYDAASARASGRPRGSVMTVVFDLAGQRFVALNGGPDFRFTEAVSFVVNCRTQAEIDYYWRRLSAGGKPGPCGWLKDRFGLSWQVVPEDIEDLLSPRNPARAGRVMAAVLQMSKLDLAVLRRAARG